MNDAAGSAAVMTEQPAGQPPWELAPPEPDPLARPARPAPPAAGPPPRRRRGGWWTCLPYLAVLAAAGTGLWWTWESAERLRGGTVAVAGALFVAALARLVLPEEWAGMLASRKRFIDVVTLVALAAGLLAAGLVLPTSS